MTTQGEARLRFSSRNGSTILSESSTRAPLHLSDRLVESTRVLPAYALLASGGGLLGNEKLTIQVQMDRDARAKVGSIGATRLLPAAVQSRVEVQLDLKPGSRLAFTPEPLIPCYGASFEQCTSVTLAGDAAVCIGDIVTPGRLGSGESFSYRKVGLRLHAELDGVVVAQDHLLLEPGSSYRAAVLGTWTHVASMVIIGSVVDTALLEHIQQERGSPELILGASRPATDVITIRALSTSAYRLSQMIQRVTALFFEE